MIEKPPGRPRWVITEAGGRRFRCMRCGDTAKVPLPLPIQTWCEMADAFSKAHAGCKEPEAHGDQ